MDVEPATTDSASTTQTAGEAMLTDEEIEELVEREARQAKQAKLEAAAKEGGETTEGDEGAAEGGSRDEPQVTVDPADARWLALKQLGVTPEQLVEYAKKGWDYEQMQTEAAKNKAAELEKAAKAKPGSKDYMTREEHEKAIADMEKRMQVAAAGAHAHARLSTMLDQAGLTDAEDPIGRRIVTESTIQAMAKGVTLETAYREAKQKFDEYIAKRTATEIRKKIQARGAAGEVGSGEAPVAVVPDKMEHKADDFDTGKAFDDAMAFMKKQVRATGRR